MLAAVFFWFMLTVIEKMMNTVMVSVYFLMLMLAVFLCLLVLYWGLAILMLMMESGCWFFPFGSC